VSVQLIVLSSVGSAFQAEGLATEKARSANLVRVRGMTYELLADERIDWNGWPFHGFTGQIPVGRLVPCCLQSHASECIVYTARGKQQAANVVDVVPMLCGQMV